MRSGARLILFLTMLLASRTHAAGPPPLRQLPRRRLAAVRITAPPTLDGRLDDPAWREAVCVDGFVGLSGGPATQRTRALVGCDAAALYVAFECFEAQMGKVLATIEERDGALWQEDCVEVFIDANRDRKTYVQIEVSPRGVVADKRCVVSGGRVSKDAGWDCEGLTVAVDRGTDRWRVETRIPFSGLGAELDPDGAWGLNLTRTETPHGEISSWAAASGTFHDPRAFGVLAYVRHASLQTVRVGWADRNTRILQPVVRNGRRQRDLAVVLEVVSGEQARHSAERKLSLAQDEERELLFRYPLAGDAAHTATLTLIDPGTGRKLDAVTDELPKQYFKPSDECVTPHTRWAKPLAGGPLRVLFLTPYFTQRDVVELSQRLSLDARVVSFLTSRWDLPERPSTDEYLELVRRELAGELDAIVIDRPFVLSARRHGSEHYSGATLAPDILDAIRAKIAAGTGLILFSHGRLPASWEGAVLDSPGRIRAGPGAIQIVRPHFAAACIPFRAFASLSLPAFECEAEPVLAVNKRAFLAEASHGKGRILVFGHSRNGVVPPARTPPSFRHWDYYHAFLARCLVWAARREPGVCLRDIRVEPDEILRGADGVQPKAVLSLGNSGAKPAEVSVTCRFRNPFSETAATETGAASIPGQGAAEFAIPVPDGLAGGLHFADVVLSIGGKVVDWGATMFRVRTPWRIAAVAPERTVLRAGRRLRGRVTLEGGRGPADATHARGDAEARREGSVGFVPGKRGQALLPGEGAVCYAAEGNFDPSRGALALWVALGDRKTGPNGRTANWWWRTPHAFRVIHYPDRSEVSFQVRPDPDSNEGGVGLPLSVADWNEGEWRHVVWTWAPTGLRAFVDGELAAESRPAPMPRTLRGGLRIGHVKPYAPTTARLDGLAVYARPLAPGEVAAAFRATAPPSGEHLLLYAPFDATSGAPADACRLRLRLVDRLGRLVGEQWREEVGRGGKQVAFSFQYDAPVARSARVEACLFDERGLASGAQSPWIELAERGLEDFLYFCWDWNYSKRHPDYVRQAFYRRLAEQGVDGTDGRSSLDFKLVTGLPFPGGKRNTVDGKPWYDVFQELRAGYTQSGDKKFLARRPCLSDPDTWRQYRARLASAVASRRPGLPVAYGLADENTITFESIPLDFCFSEHCLREFRTWARRQYGDLQALNRSWEATFPSWEEVTPMTAEEVKGRVSYAPWADHRAFMETVFARAYRHAAEAVREMDSGARVSTSGTRPPFPYSACDWQQILPHLDHLMPYPRLYDQGEMHRSFARLPTMMCSGFGATGAFQKYIIWYAALHGSSAVIFSKVSSCVAADLSVHPDQPVRTAEMRDLQEGLGKVLMRADRRRDGIAVHYSTASVRAEWITAFERGAKLKYEGPLAKDRRGWLRLIEELGFQYVFLSAAQIERGALTGGAWKILIMPFSQAVSRGEAAAMRSFVKRGGTLVGSFRAATFDEHCKPAQPGLLDDVFGIARTDRLPQFTAGEVHLGQGEATRTIKDLSGGPGLVVKSAAVRGRFQGEGKDEPGVCRNRFGRGAAHYLNFLYDFRAGCRNPGAQALDPEFLQLAREILAEAGLAPRVRLVLSGTSANAEIVRFQHDATEYVCVLRQYALPEGAPEVVEPELVLSGAAWVCDVRTRRAHGFVDRVKTRLGPGETKVFALAPYEVRALRVAGPGRALPGGTLRYRARVDVGEVAPGEHVFHADVIGPDGKARRHYAHNLTAPGGAAEAAVTLARNDPPGRWRIRVRDVASGRAAELSFELVGGEAPGRARIEMRSAWEIAGIVEELRNHGVGIPERVEELQVKVCREINLQRVHDSGELADDVAEIKEILGSLPLPPDCPAAYPGAAEILKAVRVDQPRLPVLRATGFLEDRVLGVGLKSYPYVVDWDADGKRDLLVGDHDGFIYVYLNEGAPEEPAFGRATRLKSVGSGEDFVIHFNPKIDMADLAGDAKLDLVLGSHAGKALLFENVAKGKSGFAFDVHRHIELRTRRGVIDVGNYGYPELADWDGDGVVDLLMGEEEGGLHFFKGGSPKRAPRFHWSRLAPDVSSEMYPCPEIVDWDGDGLLDVVLGDRDGAIRLFLNRGAPDRPSFSHCRRLTDLDGRVLDVGRLSHPHVTDWNSDGRQDLVLGNDDGDVLVWRNVGAGACPQFDRMERLRDAGGELICGVHPVIDVADWNADGKPDLLAGGETERVRLYLNTGTRERPEFDEFSFLPGVEYTPEALCGPDAPEREFWDNGALEFTTEYVGNLAPEAVDWNGDGKLDLLLGGYTGLVHLFLNQGAKEAPRFGPGRPLEADGALLRVAGFSTPVAVDWNGDGKTDVVCGDFLGRVHVFVNVGAARDPVLRASGPLKVGGRDFAFGPRAIVEAADYDGDGKPDVLVGNRKGKVAVLLSIGAEEAPRFDRVELLRDDSPVWRQLYGGGWASPHPGSMPLYSRREGGVGVLDVVATSCPRVIDWDGDGERELLVSHRFGRVFVFEETR